MLQNPQNSGDGRRPPPPVTPTSFFRSEPVEERWVPTAPTASPLPNTSHHHPVYAEELHLPPSPSRSSSSSGHREPYWLRFRRGRWICFVELKLVVHIVKKNKEHRKKERGNLYLDFHSFNYFFCFYKLRTKIKANYIWCVLLPL